ncbi:MAG: alpha/beta hydrolase [Ferruginibacter sp.]
MKEKKIIFLKKNIYYRSIGKGLPVLLLHGFGEDGSMWDAQINYLKNNFYLIIPDLPGSGRSELLSGKKISMDDYAACIYKILQQEKITKCVMIGHSMGGYITLAFAEKYPALLKAFGLFHSSAYADDAEKIITRKKAIEFIKENGAAAFLKTSVPGLFFNKIKSKTYIKTLLEKGRCFKPEALIQYYEAMIQRPDRTIILKKFKGKVLFILGKNDMTVPFQYGLEQSHFPSQSYIYVLRNSAHMGMQEETAKANKSLTAFLESL